MAEVVLNFLFPECPGSVGAPDASPFPAPICVRLLSRQGHDCARNDRPRQHGGPDLGVS